MALNLNPHVLAGCKAAARKYKVPLPTIIGITLQESAGKFQAPVHGRMEPLIRWEGHYFDKRLSGDKKALARRMGLASPKVGGVKNPRSQQDRWDDLLGPGMAIDKCAAVESVSWGLGQVMGAHWKKLGFSSCTGIMDHARKGITEQIDLMMKYCVKFGLIDELQRGDIEGFVRGYNGTGAVASYSKSIRKYIRQANAEYGTDTTQSKVVDDVPVTNIDTAKKSKTFLRMGTSGARVREAQELMRRDGITVDVDGDFGPATKKAVEAYQRKHGLKVDGMVGPETWSSLQTLKVDPDEQPGVPGPAEAIVKTEEGAQGAGTAIVGGGLTAAIDPAKDALYPVVGSGGWIDTIYTMLTIAGVIITIGGLAWIGYGWLKAKRTRGVSATGE